MIGRISKGDTVKCLACGKPIKLTDETFTMDWEAEYITCPECGATADVQVYHMHGEKVNG